MKRTLSALALAAAATLLSFQDPKPAEASLIAVGQTAPELRLNDHTGRAVGVRPPGQDQADAAGNWKVLAFFPKAATPG